AEVVVALVVVELVHVRPELHVVAPALHAVAGAVVAAVGTRLGAGLLRGRRRRGGAQHTANQGPRRRPHDLLPGCSPCLLSRPLAPLWPAHLHTLLLAAPPGCDAAGTDFWYPFLIQALWAVEDAMSETERHLSQMATRWTLVRQAQADSALPEGK